MDRVFEDLLSRSQANIEGNGTIEIKMVQTDDAVIIKASIPGVKPEDINTSITGDTLTIRGETKEDEEFKNSDYHIREMRFGSFARSILLPCHIIYDKSSAEFEDGVLRLTLPKAEEVKPKTITIKAK